GAMLESAGDRKVAVLDGGCPAVVAAGLTTTTEVVAFPPAELHLASSWRGVIDRDALRGRLGSVVLLDARAGPRYRGEIGPLDPVAGHLPTARSARIEGNLAEGGRFLAPSELAARFAALGADGSEDVVTSCGSGVSATHNALPLRAPGLH